MIEAGEIGTVSNQQQEATTIKRSRKKKKAQRLNTQSLTNNKEIAQITANYYIKKQSMIVTGSNFETNK